MSEACEGFEKKVAEIFCELAGPERAKWLGGSVPSRCTDQIAKAVIAMSDFPEKVGWDIGFHVSDWQADAAFLVALHLFPERFTDKEIDDAVRSLLIHVPAHVIAAARLAGHSTQDVFSEQPEA